MNAATFLVALRRRANAASDARAPLAEAKQFLGKHGHTAEGMALRKVMNALITGDGEFSESEVWLFSEDSLSLVAALIDARTGGGYLYTTDDFRAALDR
jgi:hypothetical protein